MGVDEIAELAAMRKSGMSIVSQTGLELHPGAAIANGRRLAQATRRNPTSTRLYDHRCNIIQRVQQSLRPPPPFEGEMKII